MNTQDDLADTRCTRRRAKWKYFAVGMVVVSVVLLVLVACLWSTRDFGGILASAGLARLPESAGDLVIERQGGIFEWQFINMRFTASKDDMNRFVDESTVARVDDSTAPALGDFRLKGFATPEWWPKRAWLNNEVYGVTSGGPLEGVWINGKRYYGALVVDRETNTVYLRFMGQSRLFRLRRALWP